MGRRYKVVDVFGAQPLMGNPVAVVLDAIGLDTASMLQIARWTALSETTFVLPPDGPEVDYRLRIFSPGGELRFAGHPTLGSAHAVVEAGMVTPLEGVVRQRCLQGVVPVSALAGNAGWALRLPAAQSTPLAADALPGVLAALGVGPEALAAAPAVVDVGPRWLILALDKVGRVLDLQPDAAALAAWTRAQAGPQQGTGLVGVTVFARYGQPSDAPIEVRSFAPAEGIIEDPVCGSGQGCVAVYQAAQGWLGPLVQVAPYEGRQGRVLHRDGRVQLRVGPGTDVQVGGVCRTLVDGTLDL
jgi:PhzF family phenazine biosynthesis protein